MQNLINSLENQDQVTVPIVKVPSADKNSNGEPEASTKKIRVRLAKKKKKKKKGVRNTENLKTIKEEDPEAENELVVIDNPKPKIIER